MHHWHSGPLCIRHDEASAIGFSIGRQSSSTSASASSTGSCWLLGAYTLSGSRHFAPQYDFSTYKTKNHRVFSIIDCSCKLGLLNFDERKVWPKLQ